MKSCAWRNVSNISYSCGLLLCKNVVALVLVYNIVIWITSTSYRTWWRHAIGMFSALPALCGENPPVNCGSPSQRFCNAEFIFCCIEHALLTKQSSCGDLRRRDSHCSGSLEPESSCHDRDWIMELPMEADILTFTGVFTPEDASVASCFPFDITISLSWFPLLSIPPLHSAIL